MGLGSVAGMAPVFAVAVHQKQPKAQNAAGIVSVAVGIAAKIRRHADP